MLQIEKFTFNMFGVNSYVVYDTDSRQALIVDPGTTTPAEMSALTDFVALHGLSVRYVVCTHLHLDHAFGANALATHYGVPLLAHKADAQLGAQIQQQAAMFGLPGSYDNVIDFQALSATDTITLGEYTLDVIHTPGHSPGGVCLYCPAQGWVISGDTLFQGSIGRTDLPGGDHPSLLRSVRQRLLTLPPHTVVYPGHGPATTIGHEVETNPFFQ